jgi:hypothetical protein
MKLGGLTVRPTLPLPARLSAARAAPQRPEDQGYLAFSALAEAYRRNGGLMCADSVLQLMRPSVPQPISALARLIVARQVVCLAWQSVVLLPMFQFEPSTMVLRDGARRVLRELGGVFDDQELAAWFVQPNCWIQDAMPIDLVGTDLTAVLHAARADRFIARGG